MKQILPITLSIPDACHITGVQKDTIYRAINRGELRSLKVGRRRLIRLESLNAWIAECEQTTQREMGFAPTPTQPPSK